MLGSTVTPVARPASSIPFLVLPENTFVLATMWPPVEVTSRPSFPLGAAPLSASSPPKVLNVMNLLAVPATSTPFRVLSPDTLPSGITPPTTVFFEEPLTRMPSPLFPTADARHPAQDAPRTPLGRNGPTGQRAVSSERTDCLWWERTSSACFLLDGTGI